MSSTIPPTTANQQPSCQHILESNTGYRIFSVTLNPNVPCEKCAAECAQVFKESAPSRATPAPSTSPTCKGVTQTRARGKRQWQLY
jgi:hypothetical protein